LWPSAGHAAEHDSNSLTQLIWIAQFSTVPLYVVVQYANMYIKEEVITHSYDFLKME